MEKVVIHRPGDYRELKLEPISTPAPGKDEFLVETSAIGVNYADCCVRWGVYKSAKEYVGWPITPGFEFAGTIYDPNSENGGGKKAVFGITRFGAYSTHLTVPSHQVYPLPKGFTPEEAAGFPAVAMTAYHALFQNLALRPGMKILVHSAAGGVGTALLQLGRIAGCEMIGVVGSTHKIETAEEYGASAVIDKSKTDLWTEAKRLAPKGYDVILDANGPATLKQSYEHLAPVGKLVTYGFHNLLPKEGGRINYLKLIKGYFQVPRFNPLTLTTDNKSVIAFNLSFLFDRTDLIQEGMRDLLKWVEEGKLRPPKVKVYPLSQVGEAHRAIESGQTVGKLVLVPDTILNKHQKVGNA